jgi:hypothetical protein
VDWGWEVSTNSPFLDAFTESHLDAWLKRNGYYGDTRKLIEAQLAIDPKQVERLGWPEILALAERNQKAGML